MRIALMVAFLLIQTGALAGDGAQETESGWPAKGTVVYVSRVLHPDSGRSMQTGNATADYVGGRSERNPVTTTDGAAANLGLPACEPVEVRKIKEKSLRVRWERDKETLTTLGKSWKQHVHRTKSDCLDVVKRKTGASSGGRM